MALRRGKGKPKKLVGGRARLKKSPYMLQGDLKIVSAAINSGIYQGDNLENKDETSAARLELARKISSWHEVTYNHEEYSISEPSMVTAAKTRGYTKLALRGGEWFYLKTIRVGARGQFIFTLEPIKPATDYVHIEVSEIDGLDKFPSLLSNVLHLIKDNADFDVEINTNETKEMTAEEKLVERYRDVETFGSW